MNQNKLLSEFIRYAFLSILSMAAVSFFIIADTFFIERGMGTDGLTALNLAMPVYDFVHGAGLMLGMGGATKFSVFKSRGDDYNANKMFTITLWLGIIFSVLFLIPAVFLSKQITALLGAHGVIADMAQTYIRVQLYFAPALILSDILTCFSRNDGRPNLAMIAISSGSIANIILDYVFIFPLGMGMFGATFATGLAPVISIIILLPSCLRHKCGFKTIRVKPDKRYTRENLALGFPSMLAQLSAGIVTIVFNFVILNLMGNTGVAAYGVTANLSLVIVAIYTGIGQGMQPLISREYGNGKTKNISALLRYGMVTISVISIFAYALLFIFAVPISDIFNSASNPELRAIAVPGIKIYFTAIIFMGFNIILSTYFTSIEKAIPAQIISLLRGLILIIPAAIIFGAVRGMTGVWLALPVTELLTGITGIILYKNSKGL